MLYVFNLILLTNVVAADIYHLCERCERAFTFAKNIYFYIKNKRANPAQMRESNAKVK